MKQNLTEIRPTFIFEEGEMRQVFEFILDDQGNPCKLGDGTYGVVYKVRGGEEDLAVKLYYSESNKMNTKSGIDFTAKQTELFRIRFKLNKNDNITKQLHSLEKYYPSLIDFLFEVNKIGLEKDQFDFLVEQSQEKMDAGIKMIYEYERWSTESVRKALRKRGFPDSLTGLVEIKAGTDNFRASDAFKLLKNKFIEEQMEISNYSIIMTLYKFTLKDLLIRPTKNFKIRNTIIKEIITRPGASAGPIQVFTGHVYRDKAKLIKEIEEKIESKDIQNELINGIHELNGYELLKAMGYTDQINTILPYLLDISQGLRALHMANKFHYDLKPANIFVRLKGERVESVIGDLGYFMVPETAFDTINVRESLPLGTRHYRSPEQKDYFDICDVEVDEEGNLVIRDPKFEDTIIEEHDFVVLSKDNKRRKNFIEKIESLQDWKKVILEKKGGPERKLPKDERTQALFFKQQKLRTDLFGFGAIVFDMLTGGKSPERFYDTIRIFDKENEDVTKIMEKYKQVSNYQVTDPGLIHIFSDFKNEETADYAPEEIVEIILKCMLYKTSNTYYSSCCEDYNNEGSSYKAMDSIFNKLLELSESKKYTANYFNNHLINLTYPGLHSQVQADFIEARIISLQDSIFSNWPNRLAQGIWYYKKLAELIQITLEKKESSFFIEILPKNIIVDEDERLKFLFKAYQKENDYENDLRQDLVYARINRDITNPFVPNYLSFMRRKLQLRPISSDQNEFEYRFVESALLGDTIELDDWIVIGANLCKVIMIKNNRITLEYSDDLLKNELIKTSIDNNLEKWTEFIFYKNLDPCTYYLQMLGIYLYHIFFVGLGSSTKDKPLRITIAQSARHLSNLEKPVKIREFKMAEYEKNIDLQDIYYFLTNIYLNLTFSNHEQSYYKKENKDKGRISAVLDDARKLQIMIAKYIHVRPADLDRLNRGIQSFQVKPPQEFPDDIDFDTLIRTFVDVSFKTIPTPKWKLFAHKVKNKSIFIILRVKNKLIKIDILKIIKKLKININIKK